jgi:integrase/recombinase XerD
MKNYEKEVDNQPQICYNKDNGKGAYTITHTQLQKGAGRVNELTISGGAEIVEQQTINADLFTRWTSYIDAKPKTIETYSKAIKQFFLYLSENGIRQPQREDIIAYRDHLKQSHKPTTVQSYLMAVKLFFQWTAQERIYPNVAERVKGAKLDSDHKKDYLTPKQVTRLLNTVDRSTLKGLRDYAILALMVTSGLRDIEVSRANIEDMRTVADFTALYIQGKGHEEKTDYVKLAEPVEEAVRDYLKARGEKDAKEPLFGSIANRNSGGRMTTRSISRIAKEHLIAAGLESDRLTAHSLRHTTATLNLLNGGTVEETQQLLRHTNINTTLIYSHALDRAKNNSEERVAKAIFG